MCVTMGFDCHVAHSICVMEENRREVLSQVAQMAQYVCGERIRIGTNMLMPLFFRLFFLDGLVLTWCHPSDFFSVAQGAAVISLVYTGTNVA
jgi:hypothetical protein